MFTFWIVLWLVAATVLIALISLLLSRLPSSLHVAAILLIGLAVSAYLFATNFATAAGSFLYLKLLTLVVSALILAGLRFWKWTRYSWALILGYLILWLNIFEAVAFEIFDVVTGGPERLYGGNLLNAAAGIILLLTQARPRLIATDSGDPGRNLFYDLGPLWVLVYTVWNFTFVYGTNPPGHPTGEWAGMACVHLGAPLLLVLFARDSRLYIQMRTYALYLSIALVLLVPYAPFVHRTPNWHSFAAADFLAGMSLTFAVLLLLKHLRAGRHGNLPANPVEWLAGRLP